MWIRAKRSIETKGECDTMMPTVLALESPFEPRQRPTTLMSDTDKVNILVVDDLPEKLLVMDSVLAELGQTLITASSGEEALRKDLEHEFAVILLDVNM